MTPWLSFCCAAPVTGMDVEDRYDTPITCTKCGKSLGEKKGDFYFKSSYSIEVEESVDYKRGQRDALTWLRDNASGGGDWRRKIEERLSLLSNDEGV